MSEPVVSDTQGASRWRRHEACVDYLVYVHPLPVVPASLWQAQVARMRALGTCHDTSFGVTTVRGPWGFFQIPAPGFPELKATFFQISEPGKRRCLLQELQAILEMEIKEMET